MPCTRCRSTSFRPAVAAPAGTESLRAPAGRSVRERAARHQSLPGQRQSLAQARDDVVVRHDQLVLPLVPPGRPDVAAAYADLVTPDNGRWHSKARRGASDTHPPALQNIDLADRKRMRSALRLGASRSGHDICQEPFRSTCLKSRVRLGRTPVALSSGPSDSGRGRRFAALAEADIRCARRDVSHAWRPFFMAAVRCPSASRTLRRWTSSREWRRSRQRRENPRQGSRRSVRSHHPPARSR